MDQMFRANSLSKHDVPMQKSGLRHLFSALLLACALIAVLVIGVRLGRTQFQIPGWLPGPIAALIRIQAKPAGSGPIVYYRDPDGKPEYSAQPKKTPDGRDY